MSIRTWGSAPPRIYPEAGTNPRCEPTPLDPDGDQQPSPGEAHQPVEPVEISLAHGGKVPKLPERFGVAPSGSARFDEAEVRDHRVGLLEQPIEFFDEPLEKPCSNRGL